MPTLTREGWKLSNDEVDSSLDPEIGNTNNLYDLKLTKQDVVNLASIKKKPEYKFDPSKLDLSSQETGFQFSQSSTETFLKNAHDTVEGFGIGIEEGYYNRTGTRLGDLAITTRLDAENGSVSPEEIYEVTGIKVSSPMSLMSAIYQDSLTQEKQEINTRYEKLGGFGKLASNVASVFSSAVDPIDLATGKILGALGVKLIGKMGFAAKNLSGKAEFAKDLVENIAGNALTEPIVAIQAEKMGEDNNAIQNIMVGSLAGTAIMKGLGETFKYGINTLSSFASIMAHSDALDVDPTKAIEIVSVHLKEDAKVEQSFKKSVVESGIDPEQLIGKSENYFEVREKMKKMVEEGKITPENLTDLNNRLNENGFEKMHYFSDEHVEVKDIPDSVADEIVKDAESQILERKKLEEIPEDSLKDRTLAEVLQEEKDLDMALGNIKKETIFQSEEALEEYSKIKSETRKFVIESKAQKSLMECFLGVKA